MHLKIDPIPVQFDDALRYLRDKKFLEDKRHQAQHFRARREGAHPDILAFERAFIRRMRKLGVPVFAHSVVRTHAEQRVIHLRGTGVAPGESAHNHGKAVDLVHGLRAWDMPRPCWLLFGHIGKEVAQSLGIKVRWGGDFKSRWDPAHWELHPWESYPPAPQVAATDVEALLAYYEGAELPSGGECKPAVFSELEPK